MERSTETPRANAEPPRLDATLDILKELLSTERNRLKTAERIENERNIVFPETSVIIHDIIKLSKEIESRQIADDKTVVDKDRDGNEQEPEQKQESEWGSPAKW